MIVSAAQFTPIDGDVDYNINIHSKLNMQAARAGSKLIIFPEMSLTGYHRKGAKQLAISIDDERLNQIKNLAMEHDMIVVTGAPVPVKNDLHIGAYIFMPDGEIQIYIKHHLHEDEDRYFIPSFDYDPYIIVGDMKCKVAICADISHPEHAKAANCDLYLASIFYSPGGLIEGYQSLGRYAMEHNMSVLMSNYSGESWGFKAGGKSAYWDSSGTLIASLSEEEEGVLVIDVNENKQVIPAMLNR